MAHLIKVSEGGNAPGWFLRYKKKTQKKTALGRIGLLRDGVRTRNTEATMYKTLFKMEYLDNKKKTFKSILNNYII